MLIIKHEQSIFTLYENTLEVHRDRELAEIIAYLQRRGLSLKHCELHTETTDKNGNYIFPKFGF